MKFSPKFLRRCHWLNLPGALLVMLLQRTPVLRMAAAADEMVAASPLGAILRSAVASIAALGTMHTLAGATEFVINRNPVSGTVGQALSPAVSFTYNGTPTPPASFRIFGTLPPGLRIIPEPSGGIVNSGTPVITGTPTLAGSFQIEVQGFNTPGATGNTNDIQVAIVFEIAGGTSTSPPAFTTQPVSQIVNAGSSVTFTVLASGSPAPTFQWQKDNAAIAGATSATLTLANVQLSAAGSYRAIATNSAGNATSAVATLVVNTPSSGTAPTIVRAPVAKTVSTNNTAVFAVDATGTPAPTYQWRKNGANISGATSRTLVLTKATAADVGAYSVLVANGAGSVTSTSANLTVNTEARFGHLTNLSVRTTMVGAETSFTVGTYLGAGTAASMGLLVRAVGPSLSAFGLVGIPDTKVVVSGSGQVVASNDNWDGNQMLADLFPTVGAFPLSDTKDAVVFKPDMLTGAYTIEVSAVGSPAGEVIAELYDPAPSSAFSASGLRLINVSVRKDVSTDGTLTAGFYVDGLTARTVLVRAIGPGLAIFGVPGTMPDPQLTLYDGQQAVLADNDNWGGDPQLSLVGTSVGAFAIGDPNTKDAMLVITLPPGAYTAAVRGNNGGGNVLVEVYEVP